MPKVKVARCVRFVVEPKAEFLDLLNRYVEGLRYVLWWIHENKTYKLSEVHHGCYRILRERYGLPPNEVSTCVREAIAIYKAWKRNPHRGRFPVIKRKFMWIHYRDYKLDLANQRFFFKGIEAELLHIPKTIVEVLGWERKEACLYLRDGKLILAAVFRGELEVAEPSDRAIAVDVNLREIVYGRPGHIRRDPTRIEECIRLRQHIERLQKKYSNGYYRKWLQVKQIRLRIRELHKRIRGITEAWAKEEAKRIVLYAKSLGCDTIVLEDLRYLNQASSRLSKKWRPRLIHSCYSRLHYWIEWQALKHGLAVVYVKPHNTSTTCPRCGSQLQENGHRQMKCSKCGYTGDRDEIAVLNLLNKHLREESYKRDRPKRGKRVA